MIDYLQWLFILLRAELKIVSRDDFDVKPINLLVAAERNGPTGDIDLTFIKSNTRFESAAKISGDDVPAAG